jgi:hypothetical protein
MLESLTIALGVLFLFHVTLYYTNTDLMQWMRIDPIQYLFPQENETTESTELIELKEQLEKKINEYKNA